MALLRLSTAIQPTVVMVQLLQDMETQSIAAMALHLQTTEIPVTTAAELPRPRGAVYNGTTTHFRFTAPFDTVEVSRPNWGEFIRLD